jgi:hypothetical protein
VPPRIKAIPAPLTGFNEELAVKDKQSAVYFLVLFLQRWLLIWRCQAALHAAPAHQRAGRSERLASFCSSVTAGYVLSDWLAGRTCFFPPLVLISFVF